MTHSPTALKSFPTLMDMVPGVLLTAHGQALSPEGGEASVSTLVRNNREGQLLWKGGNHIHFSTWQAPRVEVRAEVGPAPRPLPHVDTVSAGAMAGDTPAFFLPLPVHDSRMLAVSGPP